MERLSSLNNPNLVDQFSKYEKIISPTIDGAITEEIFLPGGDPNATDQLLELLWRKRQRSLLMIGLQILSTRRALAQASGFEAALEIFKFLPQPHRRRFLEYPPMRIWLSQMLYQELTDNKIKSPKETILLSRLNAFHRLIEDVTRNKLAYLQDGHFLIQRFDVDPILAEIAPPSYVFERLDERISNDRNNPYTITFFRSVVDAALGRICDALPEMAVLFPKFVKTIIHLPDIEFRSCSAQRYAGAIMLSAGDESLLAVEESLVHEYGHQILYCVMESDPLIRSNSNDTFVLPWSGSERDAYGYFHATYIYLLLALYFEQALKCERTDLEAVEKRLGEVLEGLERAIPDFERANFFTRIGFAFYRKMASVTSDVLIRNRGQLKH